MAPVWNNAALKTNIAPTVTVAVLLKPAIPSSGVMIPERAGLPSQSWRLNQWELYPS